MKKRNYEIDMCNGTLMDKIVSFALPLMLSSILQLLFNSVDIIVVGRFSGSEALAAVGATTSLISAFVNLFIGISVGTNVLTARYYARHDDKNVSITVHTSVAIAIISGIAMAFVGFFFARPALELMQTPANVIDRSVLYMRIYFIGMPFFMLYNYGAAILRAVGDTKRPLIFLIISGVLNAGLNVLFVTVFKLDVAGVAIATVISLFVSCALVLRCLFVTDNSYKLTLTGLCIKKRHLIELMRIGVPAGIQSVVICFSNVLLQSSVNTFGATAMAGYTAADNVFGYLYVSVNSVSQACMSFTSQNLGAGKPKRMDMVLRDCMALQVTMTLFLGSAAFLAGRYLISIYNNSPEVIDYGMDVLMFTTVPYFIFGLMDLFPGALRGMGYSTLPMIFSVVGTVGTRVVWIYLIFPFNRSLDFLFISYPVSWTVTVIMQVICYIFVRKKVHRLMA